MHPETLHQYEMMKAHGDGHPWLMRILAGPRHLHVPASINTLAYEISCNEALAHPETGVPVPTSGVPISKSLVLTVDEEESGVSCQVITMQSSMVSVRNLVGGMAFPVGSYSLSDGSLCDPNLRGEREHIRVGVNAMSTEQRDLILLRVGTILSLVNQPRFVEVLPEKGHRAHCRRVQKITGLAASAWSTVSWKLGKGVVPKFVKEGEPGHHKALHWCRAHWRRAEPNQGKAQLVTMPDGTKGWYTWVKDSWRGDPAYGVKLQRHQPFLEEADRSSSSSSISQVKPETKLKALGSAQREALVESGHMPSDTLH
jgi:hypothetical protein